MSTARLVTLCLLGLGSCILQYEEEANTDTDTDTDSDSDSGAVASGVWETDKPPTGPSDDGAAVLCGAPGSKSLVASDGRCACEEGFEWCVAEPRDYTCCAPETDSAR